MPRRRNVKMMTGRGTSKIAHNNRHPQPSSSKLKNEKDEAKQIQLKDHDHMVAIFPEELWSLIFDKVENPEDLKNLSNSNSFFRQLLLSQRTQFLFSSVWPELEKKYKENEKGKKALAPGVPQPVGALLGYDRNLSLPVQEEKDGDSDSWSTVSDDGEQFGEWISFPQVIGYSSYTTVFQKLRLVCRSWNETIETFYENHPQNFQLAFESGDKNWNQDLATLKMDHWFNEDEDHCMGRFLRHFASTHVNTNKNPFFTRHLSLSVTGRRDAATRTFAAQIDRALAAYGHHIWYCHVNATEFRSLTVCYTRIREILQKMPNLKVLDLCSGTQGKLQRKDEKALKAEIRRHPLPTFNELQMIRPLRLYPLIFHELLRSNDQVSILSMQRYAYPQYYGIYSAPLSNLQSLQIGIDSEQEFERLVAPQVNWSLKKLRLNFDTKQPFISWERVFRLIQEKWAGTLTHLEITLPRAHEKIDKTQVYEQNIQVNFPRLTHLKLKMKNVTCLDFLLPLRHSLVDLDLEVRRVVRSKSKLEYVDDPNVETGGIIQLFSYPAYHEYYSNVGKIFRKLKRFHLHQTFAVMETEERDFDDPYPDPIDWVWDYFD